MNQEKVDQRVAVPSFTESIYVAGDGKRIYALAHTAARTAKGPLPKGVIAVLDTPSLTLAKTIRIDNDPFALAVTKEGILFVSGRGGVRSDITVVDVNKEPALVANWRGVPPNAQPQIVRRRKSALYQQSRQREFRGRPGHTRNSRGQRTSQRQWTQPTPAAAPASFLLHRTTNSFYVTQAP